MIDESLFAAALSRRRPGTVWQRLDMAESVRPVWVCLPASASSSTGLAYPVIYLEGGDEWFGDEACGLAVDAWTDELARRGHLAESILVALGSDTQAGVADFSPEQGEARGRNFW